MLHTHGIYREIFDRQACVYVLLINENVVFNFQITSVNFIYLHDSASIIEYSLV